MLTHWLLVAFTSTLSCCMSPRLVRKLSCRSTPPTFPRRGEQLRVVWRTAGGFLVPLRGEWLLLSLRASVLPARPLSRSYCCRRDPMAARTVADEKFDWVDIAF